MPTRFLAGISAFLFFACALAWGDPASFAKKCRESGGVPVGGSCSCMTGKTFINPFQTRCPAVSQRELHKMLDAVKNANYCDTEQVNGEVCKPTEPKVVHRHDFCANPHKYLCAPEFNPAVRYVEKAMSKFEELYVTASAQPAVIKFIHEKSDGKAEHCSDLKKSDATKCDKLIYDYVISKIKTPEREAKVRKAFAEARAAVLRRLEIQKNVLTRARKLIELNNLERMIDEVRRAELSFEHDSSLGTSFNASAQGATTFLHTPKIYANALSLLGSEAPSNLFFVYTHELAHIADSGSLRGNINPADIELFSEKRNGPFASEVACLERKEAAGSHVTDVACLRGIAKKLKASDKELSKRFDECADHSESNIHATVWCDLPSFEKRYPPCANAQAVEVFADWVAAEASAEHLRGTINLIGSAGLGKFDDGEPAIRLNERFKRAPVLLEIFGLFCTHPERETEYPNDSHQSHATRMNRVFLTQPLFRKAIGCEAEPGPAYCGEHLYQKGSAR